MFCRQYPARNFAPRLLKAEFDCCGPDDGKGRNTLHRQARCEASSRQRSYDRGRGTKSYCLGVLNTAS